MYVGKGEYLAVTATVEDGIVNVVVGDDAFAKAAFPVHAANSWPAGATWRCPASIASPDQVSSEVSTTG